MFRIIPYVMAGIRMEYKIIQQTESAPITKQFAPLHLSAAIGAGIEFVSYGNVKLFIESFYNPDLMRAYKSSSLNIFNKNFELRVGLKYQIEERSRRCNTP